MKLHENGKSYNIGMHLYTYNKRGNWYPHVLGGWTRLCGAINVWMEEEDAIKECPSDCKVVAVYLDFKRSLEE